MTGSHHSIVYKNRLSVSYIYEDFTLTDLDIGRWTSSEGSSSPWSPCETK